MTSRCKVGNADTVLIAASRSLEVASFQWNLFRLPPSASIAQRASAQSPESNRAAAMM